MTDAAQVRGLLPGPPGRREQRHLWPPADRGRVAQLYRRGACWPRWARCDRSGPGDPGDARELLPIVAAKLTEATFLGLPSDMGVLIDRAVEPVFKALSERDYSALLVGNGLGREKETQAFIRGLLLSGKPRAAPGRGASGLSASASPPAAPARSRQSAGQGRRGKSKRALPSLVLDADALNLLHEIEGWAEPPARTTAILTPHPGEMARLRGSDVETVQADRVGIARTAATEWQQVVVLKGAKTVIAAPDGRVQINPAATPALASAGTGDVLAGVIASLVAQGLAPFDAAGGRSLAAWPGRRTVRRAHRPGRRPGRRHRRRPARCVPRTTGCVKRETCCVNGEA